jgi:hypothetical protein
MPAATLFQNLNSFLDLILLAQRDHHCAVRHVMAPYLQAFTHNLEEICVCVRVFARVVLYGYVRYVMYVIYLCMNI